MWREHVARGNTSPDSEEGTLSQDFSSWKGNIVKKSWSASWIAASRRYRKVQWRENFTGRNSKEARKCTGLSMSRQLAVTVKYCSNSNVEKKWNKQTQMKCTHLSMFKFVSNKQPISLISISVYLSNNDYFHKKKIVRIVSYWLHHFRNASISMRNVYTVIHILHPFCKTRYWAFQSCLT